jgi:hypothetical protein
MTPPLRGFRNLVFNVQKLSASTCTILSPGGRGSQWVAENALSVRMKAMSHSSQGHGREYWLLGILPERFWPRFGLRTLLVLVLAYCCALTWYGMRWRWIEEQQEILASLDRLQPGVVMNGSDVVVLTLKGTEVRDDDLRNVGRLTALEVLDLEYTKITDAGVRHLAGLKHLRNLSIGGTKITDESLRTIGKLSTLEDLLMESTAVGDDGVAYLSDLRNLRSLDLGKTKVGDDGLAQLGSLQQIRRLYLAETRVTDRGLQHLRHHEQLRFLGLNNTTVSDAGMPDLAQLAQLETLWLHETDVTDAGLASLHGMNSLQQLELMRTAVTDAGVADLQSHLPNLRVLR